MTDNIFTFLLSNASLTLTEEMGITRIAMRLQSGAGRFIGSMRLPNHGTLIDSTSIELAEADPVSITDPNTIVGLVITADAASYIQIIASK